MTYQEMYNSNPSHEIGLYTAMLRGGKIALNKEMYRLMRVGPCYELIRKANQRVVLVKDAMDLSTEINSLILSEHNCITAVSYDPQNALELIKDKLRYDMDVLTHQIYTAKTAIKQFSDFKENTKLFTRFLKERDLYNTYKDVMRQQIDSMLDFDFFKTNTDKGDMPLTLVRALGLQKEWNKFLENN